MDDKEVRFADAERAPNRESYRAWHLFRVASDDFARVEQHAPQQWILLHLYL